MKSTEDILKEIEAAAAIPLPNGCVCDDGFEDFLHGINKEKNHEQLDKRNSSLDKSNTSHQRR
jgi:hypothetical protein